MVSKQLGHASPTITWNTYQHVHRGMQAKATERVADLIFGTDDDSEGEDAGASG